ncbi:MAG: hypothetical protein ACI4SD_00335 [Suilimivivens sp.]
MAVFQVAAFFILLLYIAYKEKEAITDVIPVAVCLLVLVLYGLSFINGLKLSDYLAVLVCVLAVLFYFRKAGEEREAFTDFVFKELKKPGTIMAIILLAAVPILVGKKAVTWWDDFNFWATDVKSIFYLNGFALKYQNVAPEFGDYPPGTQMMKWWFLHMNPSKFSEGLMFAGYYFMNLAFLTPLLGHLKKRNVPIMILIMAALWLFPSCVEVFSYDGCCADLTMAVIYGAFLTSVVDRQEHGERFYYGRLTLFLMVLVLCKNVGFLWVAFGLLFLYGYHGFVLKRFHKGMIAVTVFPVLTEGSWLLFCLLNRRVAKLTGAAVQMATGSMNVPEVQKEMINAYFTAFFRYPLHRWSTFAIDLSPLLLYLLLLLFVFLLYKRGKIERRQGVFAGIFLAVSGVCFYAINLLCHLTIFAVETQYLEPFGMVSSIERYGAPFTVGGLYLTADLAMRKKGKAAVEADGFWRTYGGILVCLAFVFLTADYNSAYRGLIGYRSEVSENRQDAEAMIDEAAAVFLEKTGGGQAGYHGRVLYLRDSSDVSWVRNTYISFYAAPVSVMYGNVSAKEMTGEDIVQAILDAHAGYLYADEIENGRKLFEALTEDGTFEYGCLYRVVAENGTVSLEKADSVEIN